MCVHKERAMWGHSYMVAICKPGRETSGETKPNQTSGDLHSSWFLRHKFLAIYLKILDLLNLSHCFFSFPETPIIWILSLLNFHFYHSFLTFFLYPIFILKVFFLVFLQSLPLYFYFSLFLFCLLAIYFSFMR